MDLEDRVERLKTAGKVTSILGLIGFAAASLEKEGSVYGCVVDGAIVSTGAFLIGLLSNKKSSSPEIYLIAGLSFSAGELINYMIR